MTEKLIRNENEAIECLKKNKPTSGYYMLQESVDMAIQALEEIQAYRAIGTIEELQALKEKAEPKKPIYKFEYDDGTKFYDCPVCRTYVMHSGVQSQEKYCSHCGTKLDWS